MRVCECMCVDELFKSLKLELFFIFEPDLFIG